MASLVQQKNYHRTSLDCSTTYFELANVRVPDQPVGRVGVDAVLGEPVEQAVIDLERDPGLQVPDVVATIRVWQICIRDLDFKIYVIDTLFAAIPFPISYHFYHFTIILSIKYYVFTDMMYNLLINKYI